MPYCFPPTVNGQPKNYLKDIVLLTRSDKTSPRTEFCTSLRAHKITALDFDEIKDDACSVRNSLADLNGKHKCKSVDGYSFKPDDGPGSQIHYFIEFKNSPAEALSDFYEGERIDSSLRKKAIDSLAVAGMTILRDVPQKNIMENAVLIVVYHASGSDTIASMTTDGKKLKNKLNDLAEIKDSLFPHLNIKWKIVELRECGFFKDVHTWRDDVFENWAKAHLA